MAFHCEPAGPCLAAVARAFWGFDERSTPGAPDERIVPDGCAEIIVQLGDAFGERHANGYREQPRVVFAGQIAGPLWLRAGARTDLFAVRLQPGGARRLGLPPQWMLAQQRVDFAEVLPLRARAAWDECLDRMAAQPSFAGRARSMRSFLHYMLTVRATNATEACIAAITGRGGDCELARVAADAGISSRQMQRGFLDAVGITPKLFARIVRFQRAFGRWDANDPRTWASVAADCGYYDQAHLLRDFRQFAGEPPAAFVAALTPLGGRLVSHSS
jgi:AraC-like DNA-binding protein